MNSGSPRQPIVILISGRGGNMRALIERSRDADSPYEVSQVFCDQADAPGLRIAAELGVPARALAADPSVDRASYDVALAAAIRSCTPALLVLAGFMRILSAQFVDGFAGKILNIHPSLLPKFPGLHTHRRALEAHEREHGATVHFVTEQLDGGPPIIEGRITVTANDDEATLATRVQKIEHRIYPLAVRWFCQGRLRFSAGQAWLDGKALREPVQFTGAQQ